MLEFSGPVWRILFASQAAAPLLPARAPEGRFHHSGQFALYASLSAEGASVAIRRYVSGDDPDRVIQRFQVENAQLVDYRGQTAASVIWQDIRATGAPSPTWSFSDKARARGADGLIYSSRSRPDLSHLVLFCADKISIQSQHPATHWRA